MKKSMLSIISVGSVLAALFVTPAWAVDEMNQDFVDAANRHCEAFLGGGGANMGFALGKASRKFSPSEMATFNQRFASKLIAQYEINASKGCVLDGMSMQPVVNKNSKPHIHDRRALVPAAHELAVVNGVLASTKADVPVSIAYRLERSGTAPWVITNITLNGQPMVDRYREEYEALANSGSAAAVLDTL